VDYLRKFEPGLRPPSRIIDDLNEDDTTNEDDDENDDNYTNSSSDGSDPPTPPPPPATVSVCETQSNDRKENHNGRCLRKRCNEKVQTNISTHIPIIQVKSSELEIWSLQIFSFQRNSSS
jgi:hypothetical protein